jgi:prepilin-type N-terminal cleavage/methylation domain-containing protein
MPAPLHLRDCPPRRLRGFSLTELLVAATISLVVMGAVAQLFSLFSRTFNDSQTTIELSGRMRTTAWQLRQDLAGLTVDPVPWVQPESDSGYLEILEGPVHDATLAVATGGASTPYAPYAIPSGAPTSNLEGDTDDILLFTTRAAAGTFTGRYENGTIESPYAEVAWFCRPAGTQPVAGTTLYNLYRRQLLVVGYAGKAPFLGNGNAVAVANLTSPSQQGQSRGTQLYDISMRLEGASAVPNSLGDLTKRENRCFLSGSTSLRKSVFPYELLTDAAAGYRMPIEATFDSTDRVWEDVILTNVIAFDVRVYDPAARPLVPPTSSTTLYPGDPGYDSSTSSSLARGAFVDLGWRGGLPTSIATFLTSGTVFVERTTTATGTAIPAGEILQSSGLYVTGPTRNEVLPVATYDTWSLHYEFNGVDDDGDDKIDQGTNGLDDNADLLPDNAPEYETSPPYPVPLKGIEVRIRVFEPSNQQVRQTTIRHTFERK